MRICCHEARIAYHHLPRLPHVAPGQRGQACARTLVDRLSLLWAHSLEGAAMTWLICGIVLYSIGTIVFTLAICKAAARGDRD